MNQIYIYIIVHLRTTSTHDWLCFAPRLILDDGIGSPQSDSIESLESSVRLPIDYLLRVGDFTTIPPRKVAARLELFQSPSSMRLVFHEDSWFRQIPDLGYVGGGFIHEDTLFEI